MAQLPILTFPDPRLRAVCTPVTNFDTVLARLAEDMLETMYDAPGRGLAAPQVGVTQRLFVIDATWREGVYTPRVLINPEILGFEGPEVTRTEGCLSLPDLPAEIARPNIVHLRHQTLSGVWETLTLSGIEATCAQHEFDHLNGRLILDLMAEEARVAASAQLQAPRFP